MTIEQHTALVRVEFDFEGDQWGSGTYALSYLADSLYQAERLAKAMLSHPYYKSHTILLKDSGLSIEDIFDELYDGADFPAIASL
jgi:aspartate/tyrosine/aromatic aminotransferase